MSINRIIAEGLFKRNDYIRAFEVCREDEELLPLYKEKFHKYAEMLLNQKNYIELLLQLKKSNLNTPLIKKAYGFCLYNLKEYDLALKYLHEYEKLDPKDVSIYLYLADMYAETDKPKSIEYYEKMLPSNDYRIYGNLARLYADVYTYGEEEKQLYYARTAYNMDRNNKVNVLNALLVTCKYGLMDEAKRYYAELQSFGEIDSSVLFSYGCALIHNKEFDAGFKLYRYRISYDCEAIPKGLKNMWQPGIDIKDKTILITYEQGFGDTFMFIRFIGELKKLCKELKIVVQDETYTLLNQNYDNVYPVADLEKIEYDYFIPIMDIPFFINLDPDNIPYKDGYLTVKDGKKLEGNRFKIGIAYGGSPDSARMSRDIPLSYLLPLLDLDADVYCFQQNDNGNQKENAPDSLIKLKFNSWEETAQAMKQMDLFVTVDCGLLNLACALGTKTFALFNKYAEFRWFDLSEDLRWYSAKPFQCKEFNQWQEPVDRMIEEVKGLIEERAENR